MSNAPSEAMDAELLAEFLTECGELLDQLDVDLVALEATPSDRERIDRAFRCLHTIKGTCGFLSLNKLEGLTHAAETLLGAIRAGERGFDSVVANGLLAAADMARMIVTSLESAGNEGAQDTSSVQSFLKGLVPQAGAVTAPAPVASPAPVAAPAPVAEEPDFVPAPPPSVVSAPEVIQEVVQNAPSAGHEGACEDSVRVDVRHLERLMNLVSELVLTRNQVVQHPGVRADASLDLVSQRLAHLTTSIQEVVVKTRMQPVGTLWSKAPRIVRDVARTCGKQARLEMEGADTELDRTLLEAIRDPLTHVIRNCVDHGIESPEARRAAGKAAEGVIRMRAWQAAGQVIIEIADDGGGIDPNRVRDKALRQGLIAREESGRLSDDDAIQLVFRAGFSTRDTVTSTSGRGVGMDVVRTNVERLGGSVELRSALGRGTTLRLSIPLTLAILSALVIAVGDTHLCVPQTQVVELLRVPTSEIEVVGRGRMLRLRGDLLPLVHAASVLQVAERARTAEDAAESIVVVQHEGRRFGLLVDEIVDVTEIVVKPLHDMLDQLALYAGATLLGDGTIAGILDLAGLLSLASDQQLSLADEARHEDAARTRPLLMLRTFDGERVVLPLEHVRRVVVYDPSVLQHARGCALWPDGDELVPIAALPGSPAPSQGESSLVLLRQGDLEVGLPVAQVEDIVEAPVDLPVRRLPGRAVAGLPGVVQLGGQAASWLDVPAFMEALS